ncbi:hypothetical protein AHF37_07258 [Paragonimus kellicotti]|nr:hypothetical protein AHF37_07258 [Paragonimus kellicotti]
MPESSSTPTATEALRRAALRTKVSRATLRIFMDELRPLHPELSLDPRTLMQTLRHCEHVKVDGGDYIHFSIRESLQFAMQNSVVFRNITTASLQLNIDGLTLFKSSSLQLWPILGRWVRPNSAVFVIGVFCGRAKPRNAHEYLSALVSELKEGMTVGWIFPLSTQLVRIQIDCIICDALQGLS